jgi:hypothetical protein
MNLSALFVVLGVLAALSGTEAFTHPRSTRAMVTPALQSRFVT